MVGEERKKIDPKTKKTEEDKVEPVIPQRVKKGTEYKKTGQTYKGSHRKK